MIPTFIIDEPFLVFLGLLAGFFIPAGWSRSVFATRAFLAGTWITLYFMALAAYGYFVAPDWMFMYLMPAERVPGWLVVYLFIFYYLLFVTGFLLNRELNKIHPAFPWIALLLSLGGSVAVVVPLWREYQTIATFDEFQRGLGIPLAESPMGKGIALPVIGMVVSGLILLIWARRQKAA